jgi:hypothetical protein
LKIDRGHGVSISPGRIVSALVVHVDEEGLENARARTPHWFRLPVRQVGRFWFTTVVQVPGDAPMSLELAVASTMTQMSR